MTCVKELRRRLVEYTPPNDEAAPIAVAVLFDATVDANTDAIPNLVPHIGVSTTQKIEPSPIPQLSPRGSPPLERHSIVGAAPVPEEEHN